MTYLEAIDYLWGIRLFGQKLGLETMRRLLHLTGDPQDSLRFIHIAGTNGKGSVAAMAQAVLSAAGYKTGLYTSPHLVSFRERFQVDGVLISRADVVRLVEQIQPALDEVAQDPEYRRPTFFETVTAIALHYFHEQKVEVVVWETGLGGRLDATNVVTPLVSVITNIAFDHMQYLGETLSQIAVEKCGIIKPDIPVVTAAADAEALSVIRRAARTSCSPLSVIEEQICGERLSEDEAAQQLRLSGCRKEYGCIRIPLLGQHQTVNCATTVAALEASGLAIGVGDVRRGLAKTNWPGRFQIISHRPTVVLDGAHNAAAAERLAAALREHFGKERLTLILGVLRDKDYDRMCRILAPLAGRICCVPVNSERTSDPAQLANLCCAANGKATVTVASKLPDACVRAKESGSEVIVITGSLFLVGEALSRFGRRSPLTAATEKELVLQ
jgi:dihydrofolate synthase/folylpolyglutamate synthase